MTPALSVDAAKVALKRQQLSVRMTHNINLFLSFLVNLRLWTPENLYESMSAIGDVNR
jgi:hypothetical protein